MALTFAQRAFAAAESLALAAALMVRFLAGALTAGLAAVVANLILAHLAFCAAATLARPAALMPPFFFDALATTGAEAPNSEESSWVNAAIFSFRSAARRNCAVVNDDNRLLIVV